MNLFRVFPSSAIVATFDQGGPLYVPTSSGQSRIDNADLYRSFYLAADPQAAIAETFGRFAVWRADTFVHASGRPYALATVNAPDDLALFDLNDIDALRSIGVMRPTDVVTRDREVTQAWARTIFERGGFAGVRWWSYYNPAWPIVGLWAFEDLNVASIEVLAIDGELVREAAVAIVRQIDGRSGS